MSVTQQTIEDDEEWGAEMGRADERASIVAWLGDAEAVEMYRDKRKRETGEKVSVREAVKHAIETGYVARYADAVRLHASESPK